MDNMSLKSGHQDINVSLSVCSRVDRIFISRVRPLRRSIHYTASACMEKHIRRIHINASILPSSQVRLPATQIQSRHPSLHQSSTLSGTLILGLALSLTCNSPLSYRSPLARAGDAIHGMPLDKPRPLHARLFGDNAATKRERERLHMYNITGYRIGGD